MPPVLTAFVDNRPQTPPQVDSAPARKSTERGNRQFTEPSAVSFRCLGSPALQDVAKSRSPNDSVHPRLDFSLTAARNSNG